MPIGVDEWVAQSGDRRGPRRRLEGQGFGAV